MTYVRWHAELLSGYTAAERANIAWDLRWSLYGDPFNDTDECATSASVNDKGYGRLRIPNKVTGGWRFARKHCLAWELVNGPVPDGLLIRHYTCNDASCSKVKHLRLGDESDNADDHRTWPIRSGLRSATQS